MSSPAHRKILLALSGSKTPSPSKKRSHKKASSSGKKGSWKATPSPGKKSPGKDNLDVPRRSGRVKELIRRAPPRESLPAPPPPDTPSKPWKSRFYELPRRATRLKGVDAGDTVSEGMGGQTMVATAHGFSFVPAGEHAKPASTNRRLTWFTRRPCIFLCRDRFACRQ